jgi:hypothetical protein
MADNFSTVDGNFPGTTDEILQWAACKWGMDQNIAKAEAIAESSWYQSTVGDNGDSYGILQVRAAPDGLPRPRTMAGAATPGRRSPPLWMRMRTWLTCARSTTASPTWETAVTDPLL